MAVDYYAVFLANRQYINNPSYEIHSLFSVLTFSYFIVFGYKYQSIDSSLYLKTTYGIKDQLQ